MFLRASVFIPMGLLKRCFKFLLRLFYFFLSCPPLRNKVLVWKSVSMINDNGSRRHLPTTICSDFIRFFVFFVIFGINFYKRALNDFRVTYEKLLLQFIQVKVNGCSFLFFRYFLGLCKQWRRLMYVCTLKCWRCCSKV